MGGFQSSPQARDTWKGEAQYAMEAGTFCAICGGPFDLEGDVIGFNPKQKQYEWLYKLNLLGSNSNWFKHEVTSEDSVSYNHEASDGVFLSPPAEFSANGSGYFQIRNAENDSPADDTWLDAYNDQAGDTLFPIHEVCIDISCRVIEHFRGKRNHQQHTCALIFLNHMLQSRFRDRLKTITDTDVADDSDDMASWDHSDIPFDTKNDLFNLCEDSSVYGPRSVVALTREQWRNGCYDKFYTNPVEVPNLMAFLSHLVNITPPATEHNSITLRLTRVPFGLERLPAELFDQISSYLPVHSVISLHRTSKALAIKNPLDNNFWRNRLFDGSLVSHLWDLDMKKMEYQQDSEPDWKNVAQLLMSRKLPTKSHDLRLENIPTGLWNRCRIWSIVEEAYAEYCPDVAPKNRSDSAVEVRTRRNPVSHWDQCFEEDWLLRHNRAVV